MLWPPRAFALPLLLDLAFCIPTVHSSDCLAVLSAHLKKQSYKDLRTKPMRSFPFPLSEMDVDIYQKNVKQPFENWLSTQGIESGVDDLPKAQLDALFLEYQEIQFRNFAEARETYAKIMIERLEGLERTQADLAKEIRGREHQIIATLGEGQEGKVYLTNQTGKEADRTGDFSVVKTFHFETFMDFGATSPAKWQKQKARLLQLAGVKAAQVRDHTQTGSSVRSEFIPGLSALDLRDATQSGSIEGGDEILETFRFVHALHYYRYRRRVGQVFKYLDRGLYEHFNPHEGNLLFEPISGRWTVVDIR